MYPSSTSNQKSLDPLHDNLVALTITSKQVNLGIERLPSVTTGSNNSPSDGSNGYLEITGVSQAFLVRTSDEDGVQPGHFSHTQMEGQTAPQGETTQGAYALQSPTTLVIIRPLSSSTAADSVSSSPSNGASLDGSGISPSRQSLAVIFGSILGASVFSVALQSCTGCVVEISAIRESKGMPFVTHVTVAKKANVQN
ncbi:hypothetical protein N7499_003609 [Penicillium canescens]|uniref:Uncharacterized protein n=1 Tax=Penicillium canescens TaxID=5083 RepID=A0AAD6N7U9_PENCN|nr:uncharacterized protein N7446_012559 [Penicillium canescens]KAJ6020336.1 hypothetical protein N7522_000411 [Penicillium canescens]KAJ6038749.1 hypothetical protein N7460_007466 [Penicillium canescens]KAJ6045695.1 hypothetical protein N7446_012559 [Penicillium canescens]KAJ6066288.1 hypothetical protein N7444_000041 [Penicillium canescens]KAJ6090895.1 hypothetical protein N7499_003609 [Penicillium canescens]